MLTGPIFVTAVADGIACRPAAIVKEVEVNAGHKIAQRYVQKRCFGDPSEVA
jgi:hypothetical protein